MCEDCWNESTVEERISISKIGFDKIHIDSHINWNLIKKAIKTQ